MNVIGDGWLCAHGLVGRLLLYFDHHKVLYVFVITKFEKRSIGWEVKRDFFFLHFFVANCDHTIQYVGKSRLLRKKKLYANNVFITMILMMRRNNKRVIIAMVVEAE